MSTPPAPPIQTYHCLCSTLLLATPYTLPTLPHRAPPSLDHAHILPLPPLTRPTPETADPKSTDSGFNDSETKTLPSLLTQNMRPARKIVVVRREDGFEKRRVWRCGRCGVGVGYEIVGQRLEGEEEGIKDGTQAEGGRVMFLLEGGLVETGALGVEEMG